MRVVREMRLAEKARGQEGVNIRPRWMCWENVPGAFSSGKPKYEDFRIVLEEIVRICFPNELIPGPYPYGWPDVGDLTAGDMFSIAWRCLDAQLCGVAQRRKRIDEERRTALLRMLREFGIEEDHAPEGDPWGATVQLADLHRLTVYDASYLELAQRRRLPLATLDEALRAAASKSAVKLLP